MFCKKKIVVSIASSGFVGSDAMFKTKPKWHEAEVLCLDGDEDPCCAVKTSRGENKLGRVFLIFEGVPQGWEKNVEVSETFCFDKRAWKKTLKSLKAEKQQYLEHLSKTKPEVFYEGVGHLIPKTLAAVEAIERRQAVAEARKQFADAGRKEAREALAAETIKKLKASGL